MKIPNTDLSIPDSFYQCPLCPKGYWNLGNLSNHVKNKHTEHFIIKARVS